MENLKIKSSQIELIKYIAIIFMILDHYVTLYSSSYDIFKIMGRIVFPLFSIVLVYNYVYNTSNKLKYIYRLAIFALISQPVYYYVFYEFFHGKFILNIFFSLSIGLTLIYLYETYLAKLKVLEKYTSMFILFIFTFVISIFLSYKIFGIFLILSVYFFIKNTNYITLFILALGIYLTNLLWSPIFSLAGLSTILILYIIINTKFEIKRMNKWFFYLIYPIHLILLTFI